MGLQEIIASLTGGGGSQSGTYTPETIARRAALAQEMLKSSSGAEPIRHWTQGANKVAEALVGSQMLTRTEQMEAERRYQDKVDAAEMFGVPAPARPAVADTPFDKIRNLLSGGSSSPAAPATTAAAVPSGASVAPAAVSAGAMPENAPAAVLGGLPAPPPVNVSGTGETGPQPRGIRNNNPLNIEAGNFTQGQPGMTGSDGRFARFENMDQGMSAAGNLLDVYAKKGINTVSGVIGRWAPAGENNVAAYAGSVARDLGVKPDDPIDLTNPETKQKLVMAMGKVENGRPIRQPDPAPDAVFPTPPPGGWQGATASALAAPTPPPAMPPGMPAGAGAGAMAPAPGAPPTPAPNMGAMAPPAPMGGQPGNPSRQLLDIPMEARKRAMIGYTSDDPKVRAQALADFAQYRKPPTEKIEPLTAAELKQRGYGPETKGISIDRLSGKLHFPPAEQNVSLSTVTDPVLASVGKQFDASLERARNAEKNVIPVIHDARAALDASGGINTGLTSTPKLMLQKVGAVFGMPSEAAVNTEVFRSTIGRQVLAHAKELGANPSNTDREFIREVEAGKGTLEEASLRKLLDLSEKYARQAIRYHNKDAEKLIAADKSSGNKYGAQAGLLTVDEPGEYVKPGASAGGNATPSAGDFKILGVR